jgi:antitoxin VapB
MRTAKIFQNGQSQAVRLPRDFRLEGKEVFVKKAGNAVVLIPIKDSWDPLVASLEMFSSDLILERDQPTHHQKRANLSP